jgi:hypothetical protein
MIGSEMSTPVRHALGAAASRPMFVASSRTVAAIAPFSLVDAARVTSHVAVVFCH